jgi:hypothetical protein
VPLGVSTAPLASASTLNIGTLTDWANPRKFTLGLLRVKLGSGEPFAKSPLFPDERTSSDRADWSVSCQWATSHAWFDMKEAAHRGRLQGIK